MGGTNPFVRSHRNKTDFSAIMIISISCLVDQHREKLLLLTVSFVINNH